MPKGHTDAPRQEPECALDTQLCRDGAIQSGTVYINATCPSAEPYVERGRDQTVPKFNATLDWPLVVLLVVANDTVPYSFGSRAVTSYTITLGKISSDDEWRAYKVTWFCTSDKDHASLVFG